MLKMLIQIKALIDLYLSEAITKEQNNPSHFTNINEILDAMKSWGILPLDIPNSELTPEFLNEIFRHKLHLIRSRKEN